MSKKRRKRTCCYSGFVIYGKIWIYIKKTFADYLHCSQVTYSRYELGTREIPLESLNALADFYGVSVDYLMGRTDEKKPYPPKRKQ